MLWKTEPSEMISMYGVARFLEGFGSSDLVMVLEKEKPWSLGGEGDSFFRSRTLFFTKLTLT